jgi:D-alanyl-D-alanine dipeptidase
MKKTIIFLLCTLTLTQAKALPKGFISLQEYIPTIQLEMRYHTLHNFMGTKVDGYLSPRAILTKASAKALAKVQQDLNAFGLGLKIFDAYRPQKAVDHFVRWGLDLEDRANKEKYYPTVEKRNLFLQGYIAKKSGHSRGSTVDLTIIDLESKRELDMGSTFDFFGKQSWVKYTKITAKQRANRMLLHQMMLLYGFKSYAQEWWHFTLRDEPYPDSYFDFDI